MTSTLKPTPVTAVNNAFSMKTKDVPLPISPEDILKKYQDERNKRLREDGLSQYLDPATTARLKAFQADPWVTEETLNPGLDRVESGDRFTVVIIGAGFGGLLFAVRLLEAGIRDWVMIDSAGGFGGTWYWNRYPGLMCDVESYIYMPLLEEMDYVPRHKYSQGRELRAYAESIAEKYGLHNKAIFQVKAETMSWDEQYSEWVVNLQTVNKNRPENLVIRSQAIISSTGILNAPKMPDLPGINDFGGQSFHTSRWAYQYTGGSPTCPDLTQLQDKRVGIIGTGATAIQCIPELAKWAKQLVVFQRTPSAVDARNNRVTDTKWFDREVRATGRGWQRRRCANFNAHVSNQQMTQDLVDDEWTRMRTFSIIVGTPTEISDIPSYIQSVHALDIPRQERIRKRVDQVVRDPVTAEKLKPWYSGWCKRPCFHDEYLPTFNRPNVTLVDTNGKGLDSISKAGPVVAGTEYPVDILIYSTGFFTPTGDSPAARAGAKIYGRGGISLDDQWAQGVTTLHGITTDNFPNLFFPGPNQAAASANQVYVLDELSEHIVYVLSEAMKIVGNGRFLVEANRQAMEEWTKEVISRAAAFAAMNGCTPSYLNLEGGADKARTPEQQLKGVRGVMWGQGIASYVKRLEQWRSSGSLDGLGIQTAA
ncbi:hypothetical protein N7451_003091 [Penicillium sp. IBT 35674x]|nr:hypothetical protein N7451_003091 [Penicillium sp. IBT 35674x]